MTDPNDIGSAPTLAGPPLGRDDSSVQSKLGDRYELLGLLGAGGMGAVYRARDTELDELVALKMLRAEFNDDGPMLSRFRTEVRLARRVTHPNVARTFDIGEHGRAKFLTMELVDGPSLAAVLAERGALPVDEAIACAICAGLAAAHAAGVVHRDLKPDNVLVAKGGRVVVTDFGIAGQHVGLDAAGGRSGIIGTPAYMAPEQLDPGAPIDLRADVYALGAVIYEMLSGERAWRGDAVMEVLSARARGTMPDFRAGRRVPPAILALVTRCMGVRPADRFASATEVAERLGHALTAEHGEGAASIQATPREPRLLAPTDKTLAVLPFRNLGPQEDAYLADGVTDDLIDTLSMTPRLRVRPRNVVDRLRSRDAPIDEIGRELGVQVIVDGSLQRVGALVRFSARLISTADGFQVWARRFQTPLNDLLVLCDDAARAIAEALTTELRGVERHAPTDAAAIELYLRGKQDLRRLSHSSAVSGVVDLFERALVLAPHDGRILAGCAAARSRALFFGVGDRERAIARAREVAEEAVAAAPDLGDAWAALASFRLNVDDPVGAARALREGSTRVPNAASVQDAVGRLLLEAGATEEAIVRLKVALQLDPTLIMTRDELARGYALLGDWEHCDALMAATEPSVSRETMRARLAMWRGAPVAIDEVPADSYMRQYIDVLATRELRDDQRAFLRDRVAGQKGRLRVLFLQRNAEIFAFVGDRASALDAVRSAVAAHLIDVLWIERCPAIEPLRAEPEWAALRDVVRDRAQQIVTALRGR